MPAGEGGGTRIGAAAEQAASDHLVRSGLVLLRRNVRYPFGELDLIMRDGRTVVFVEVRYRGSTRFGDGADSVDRRKRARLIHAAQAFLAGEPLLARQPCRFDVVAVSGSAALPVFDWIRDAFRLDDV